MTGKIYKKNIWNSYFMDFLINKNKLNNLKVYFLKNNLIGKKIRISRKNKYKNNTIALDTRREKEPFVFFSNNFKKNSFQLSVFSFKNIINFKILINFFFNLRKKNSDTGSFSYFFFNFKEKNNINFFFYTYFYNFFKKIDFFKNFVNSGKIFYHFSFLFFYFFNNNLLTRSIKIKKTLLNNKKIKNKFFFEKNNNNAFLKKIKKNNNFKVQKNLFNLQVNKLPALTELAKSFYKKNIYGFFLLNSNDYFSKLIIRLTNNSLNFNKFDMLFKLNNKTSINFYRYKFYKANLANVLTHYSYLDESFDYKYCYDFLKTNKPNSKKTIFFFNLKEKQSNVFNGTCVNNFKKIYFPDQRTQITGLQKFFKNKKTIFFPKFITTFETLIFLLNKPLFFKSIKTSNFNNFSIINNLFYFHINSFFYYNKCKKNFVGNNVMPVNFTFTYYFKKFLIKTFNFRKFSLITVPFHYLTIIKFLEFCSGKKVYFTINTFLNNTLTLEEQILCSIWSQKIKSFRKVLGHRLFLNESLQILYLCIKNKDPYILSNWILQMLYKISFWKYKLFFRYIQYVLRYFFWTIFDKLKIKGLKFQLKGKVSVAGNARTRTVLNKIGTAGHSTFKNKILYDLKLVRTFTGVIGFKTWLFF